MGGERGYVASLPPGLTPWALLFRPRRGRGHRSIRPRRAAPAIGRCSGLGHRPIRPCSGRRAAARLDRAGARAHTSPARSHICPRNISLRISFGPWGQMWATRSGSYAQQRSARSFDSRPVACAPSRFAQDDISMWFGALSRASLRMTFRCGSVRSLALRSG